ncbi:hypothetical protein M406DRAFT_291952 [Cryphonectria parasitica EP155]|uniref:Uncharacterized protein n=1 Tax=Cryphonectria parasitica (strain ATCC 38755 / EP155) TaxID=660469 RepID=A0A9P5CNX1_CRYP1|nr:uncharacterized protein M406DRAFT_291952 [Cryphonectria parasitica EP155]KAF3764777.1 hypothetical protein M406DRAFT_291952 [Cryphonectria parasitica EP155]
MPIRNPFARRQADEASLRPPLTIEPALKTPPGFERVDTVGSKASSAVSISSRRSQDKGEYKMSVVNDSGVYLPPSPTEEKASWPRRYLSRNSTDTRSEVGEIEPFGISRESFDSYRRSFDISARSPIVSHDSYTRRSMDSARFARMPRQRLFERDTPTSVEEGEGEGFEEVGLNDDEKKQGTEPTQQQAPLHPPQQKKRGFFAKFSDHNQDGSALSPTLASPSPTSSRFSLLAGRKRAQSSSQGAELGAMERPRSANRDMAREMTDVSAQA